MKYLVLSCILFFCTLQTFSQQEYFIYLQTDNDQPFYIRINNNVYSSSSTGYLILSKLADSTTTVTIGFPKNVFPEQLFNVSVNHKDAGYLLKNFGEKGWGLFNLQTLAVIMNGNPPVEKKNLEISGTRKSDAFSLLLSNAVNDTAVLYTVNRPPKPITAPPALVVTEKKQDSLAIAKNDLPHNDSSNLVKKIPEKKDSSITAKNAARTIKDTGKIAATHIPAAKDSAAITKNRKPGHDSARLVKNSARPATSLTPKNNVVKKEAASIAKNAPAQQKKDTIIIAGKPAPKGRPAIVKNKNERKDTIIMMKGKEPENNKLIAKNAPVKKANTTVKDTVQIKKEILQAPEEKRNALLNNNDAVIVRRIPIKKDKVINTPSKKDTVETIAKNEPAKPIETIADTITNAPVKRLRPLVNKAAELLTDTSYIAVFVDESKEKFDTIRISIPFNEALAYARQQKPLVIPADTLANKIIKDSTPVVVANQTVPPAIKKDTLPSDSSVIDKTAVPSVQQNTPAPVKTDTTPADKKVKDSAAASITPVLVLPPIKEDTIINKTVKDSVAVNIAKEPAAIIKKDSAPITSDSGRVTKVPAQPLFLNSDCREVAADIDIDKLRIKMLLVTSDEDRISLAKKLFKQKCFLVKQVRALSELFRSDEGKYKWFDAAYPFISDTGNFSSLADLIKDEYYLNRFKAMLRH